MSHQPRKRFGQNFLHDEQVIHAIISALDLRADDHVVEIGPGQGALTRYLLPAVDKLDVVELDRDLVSLLQRHFADSKGLRIHSADALRFDFSALAGAGQGNIRVVGNLPYNISTPLLFHLFTQSASIVDMHFMLQKEVVERLCAEPDSKNYGRLSVMAQYYCRMEPVLEVAPESFYPAPKVISAVVRLQPHDKKPVEVDLSALERVVAAAFSQRRKTLRNALGTLLTPAEIEQAGVAPNARAETLDLQDFARLAALLPDYRANCEANT
jgi:16S rRNA (adenine1518-N6/adenine1519-N6)-dimethyltransferase